MSLDQIFAHLRSLPVTRELGFFVAGLGVVVAGREDGMHRTDRYATLRHLYAMSGDDITLGLIVAEVEGLAVDAVLDSRFDDLSVDIFQTVAARRLPGS